MPRLMLLVAIASAILAAVAAPPASAHETRPAYLEIEQLEAHQYRFAFRQPQINGRFLGLSVASNCTLLGEPQQTVGSSALEDSWVADCGDAPVTESGLIVQGLERTLIDTLVLIRTKDGEETTQVLTPDSPALTVAGSGVPFVPAYFVLGVEHLIFGIDHVAFLLALMYLLRDTRKLIIAITSFTLAHSITLGVSALGLLLVPQKPVEAVIALSILVVAHDIINGRQDSLLMRHPWTLTFIFGLLHGLGFAGAMAEIGLPENSALMALLLFNLGIEAGQLMIIAATLAAVWLLQKTPVTRQTWARSAPVYAIGGMAGYWLIDRTTGILLGG